MRLVAKICRRYARGAATMDELMSEGAMALVGAMERFNPERGVSFTSYAAVVVDHAVRHAARSTGSVVRLPDRERRRRAERARAESAYFARHGRPAIGPDLAGTHPAPALPHLSAGAGAPDRSLGSEVSAGRTMAEVLASEGPSPAEAAELQDLLAALRSAVETLPNGAAEALRARFGALACAIETGRRGGGEGGLSRRGLDAALAMLRRRVAEQRAC
jgi:RNA polymerase sigma factor (sigma-70 family)